MYAEEKPRGFKVKQRRRSLRNTKGDCYIFHCHFSYIKITTCITVTQQQTPVVVKQEIVTASEDQDDQTTSTEDDVADQDASEDKKERKRRNDTISNWHCTYCHKGYKTKNGVYSHVSRLSLKCKAQHKISNMKPVWEDVIADREKKTRCGICNKGFKTYESLRVHNYNYHK